jgi:hypothetical protein
LRRVCGIRRRMVRRLNGWYPLLKQNAPVLSHRGVLFVPHHQNRDMNLTMDDGDDLLTKLQALLEARQSATTNWHQLIDYLQSEAPRPYWDALRLVDIQQEQKNIEAGFCELEAETSLDGHVVAIWVGLLQFLGDDEESELYALYSQPTNTYSSTDLEWACQVEDRPKGYVYLPRLDEVIGIVKAGEANDSDVVMTLEWLLPLAFASIILDELSRDGRLPFKPTNEAGQLYLTVGHDSGDGVNLTPIR